MTEDELNIALQLKHDIDALKDVINGFTTNKLINGKKADMYDIEITLRHGHMERSTGKGTAISNILYEVKLEARKILLQKCKNALFDKQKIFKNM